MTLALEREILTPPCFRSSSRSGIAVKAANSATDTSRTAGRQAIPFATEAPRLYDQQGNYRGKLSANPFDPDSTSNRFGRYGSPFSPESLNNQFGAGSPFRHDSPNNPYGKGWRIEGR